MRIDATMSYDAPPDEVFQVLTDPGFQDAKCIETGATSHSVDVHDDGPRVIVTTERQLPVDGLPDFLRAFVQDGIRVREQLSWSAPTESGERVADLELEFVGQPLTMRGTRTMRPDGAGCSETVAAELTARLPLIGGRIEKAAAPVVLAAVDIEESLAREWLTSDR